MTTFIAGFIVGFLFALVAVALGIVYQGFTKAYRFYFKDTDDAAR